MLTVNEILEKIHAGESSGVEFKMVEAQGGKIKSPDRDDLSDEIVAFANQDGGVIIFGIEDTTKYIVGISDSTLDPLKHYLSEICHDSVKPPVTDLYVDSVQLYTEEGEYRTVVYLQIGKSLWLHASKGGHYYRHGTSKCKMSTEHLLRIGQARSQARIIHFDEQFVPQTHQGLLQKNYYQRFIPEQSDNDTQWLMKRRLLAKDGEHSRATVAGILMCTDTPDDYLYNSFIQAVYYSGKERDANYQIDAKDCQGPLDHQIIAAFKFVEQYNRVSAIKNVGRIEKPQYSMKAVFEAIVNAVVHRDYAKHGSKIRLFLFSDRLELHSPGGLANTLTVEELPYNQVTRNELLSRLLSEITLHDGMSGTVQRNHFLERRGEGVGIILNESKQLSGKNPIYKMVGEELQLTIFAAKSLQEDQ